MNERIEALKKLATKEVWRENQHNGSPEFDGSAPIQAHSKTEYKRLVVQGANVLPPEKEIDSAAQHYTESEGFQHGDADGAVWADEKLKEKNT